MQPMSPRMPPRRLRASSHRVGGGCCRRAGGLPQATPSNEHVGLLLLCFNKQNGFETEPVKTKLSNHRGQERMHPMSPRRPVETRDLQTWDMYVPGFRFATAPQVGGMVPIPLRGGRW